MKWHNPYHTQNKYIGHDSLSRKESQWPTLLHPRHHQTLMPQQSSYSTARHWGRRCHKYSKQLSLHYFQWSCHMSYHSPVAHYPGDVFYVGLHSLLDGQIWQPQLQHSNSWSWKQIDPLEDEKRRRRQQASKKQSYLKSWLKRPLKQLPWVNRHWNWQEEGKRRVSLEVEGAKNSLSLQSWMRRLGEKP